MTASLPILLVLLGPPASDPPSPKPEPEPEPTQAQTRIQNAVLMTVGLPAPELAEALELRAPELSTHEHRKGGFRPQADELYAYVDVRPHPDAGFSLTIILSDGRAYDRHVELSGEHAPRAVATAIAQLVIAIEDDQVEPERTDVAVPPVEPQPDPDPMPVPVPQPEPGPDPDPDPDPASPFELGVPIYGPAVIGLGPPSGPSNLAALGVGIGIDARLPVGAIVGLDVRVTGREAASFSLTRVRAAISGGYDLRRGAFELDARARIGIEPWRIRRGGSSEPVENSQTGGTAPSTLLFAALSATPGVRITAGRVGLRAGVWTELAVGGVVDGGLGAANISHEPAGEDPVPLFRLGGLELGLGLQLGAWFELPRR